MVSEGGSLDIDATKGTNRHSHSREDFQWLRLYAKASGFHADDRFQQVHIHPSLSEITLTEHSHVRSNEILQKDTKPWNDLQPPYSKKTEQIKKHKATHSLLIWGGYAVNSLFNINLELFCFRNGLRVHTANTGRIDWSLSSSPPQSVKSAYSPSSRRYWRPSNPGAEYPTQLCMNKNMNHCLNQLKAINQQELRICVDLQTLRPTKPNTTTSVLLSKKEYTHRPLRIFNEPTEQSLFLLVLSGLSVSSSFLFSSSSPSSKL